MDDGLNKILAMINNQWRDEPIEGGHWWQYNDMSSKYDNEYENVSRDDAGADEAKDDNTDNYVDVIPFTTPRTMPLWVRNYSVVERAATFFKTKNDWIERKIVKRTNNSCLVVEQQCCWKWTMMNIEIEVMLM